MNKCQKNQRIAMLLFFLIDFPATFHLMAQDLLVSGYLADEKNSNLHY